MRCVDEHQRAWKELRLRLHSRVSLRKIYRLLSDLFALGERSLKLPDVVLPPDLMGMMWSMFLPLRLMFSLSYKRLAFWRSS